ncbi:hypothetical protein LB543_27645 [Mesorhizobium sp. ESP7-2]|uniref:hypothetical protein n=1 Tax=Mesorhizobium sp. ESP7-2 TaxID=2876622 RepID=UPI001CCF858F|nr:hypothetical protein [Mesorhizobium sp. ESP7-2]MBZ9710477.1 hypothetical protein [Mesorhizobium sp. ESP7-2]
MPIDEGRWLFDTSGKPAYFHQENVIYDGSKPVYVVTDDGWWFPYSGGTGEYYRSENWIFTKAGKAAFYYGEE